MCTVRRPPQYIISVVSDRWVGVKFTHEFSVSHLLLPDRQQAPTSVLRLPVSNLFGLPVHPGRTVAAQVKSGSAASVRSC